MTEKEISSTSYILHKTLTVFDQRYVNNNEKKIDEWKSFGDGALSSSGKGLIVFYYQS